MECTFPVNPCIHLQCTCKKLSTKFLSVHIGTLLRKNDSMDKAEKFSKYLCNSQFRHLQCDIIICLAWSCGRYTESSIFLCKYPPLLTAYELCTKEKIGSHGKFRISYYCIQRICCKCLWGFNLFERTNIQGAKGWRLPHNIATVLEFGSV